MTGWSFHIFVAWAVISTCCSPFSPELKCAIKTNLFPTRSFGFLSFSLSCAVPWALMGCSGLGFSVYNSSTVCLVSPITLKTPFCPSSLGFINFHLPCQVGKKSGPLPSSPASYAFIRNEKMTRKPGDTHTKSWFRSVYWVPVCTKHVEDDCKKEKNTNKASSFTELIIYQRREDNCAPSFNSKYRAVRGWKGGKFVIQL